MPWPLIPTPRLLEGLLSDLVYGSHRQLQGRIWCTVSLYAKQTQNVVLAQQCLEAASCNPQEQWPLSCYLGGLLDPKFLANSARPLEVSVRRPAYIHSCIHTYTHRYIHRYIYTYIYIYMYTEREREIHAWTHIYIYMYRERDACIDTCMDTYMET